MISLYLTCSFRVRCVLVFFCIIFSFTIRVDDNFGDKIFYFYTCFFFSACRFCSFQIYSIINLVLLTCFTRWDRGWRTFFTLFVVVEALWFDSFLVQSHGSVTESRIGELKSSLALVKAVRCIRDATKFRRIMIILNYFS